MSIILTQTNRFELFNPDDSSNCLGTVTVQLPSFELASNEFGGSGVGGKINVPTPGVMNAMTAAISVPAENSSLLAFFELGVTKGIDLRADVVGTDSNTRSISHVPVRWSLRGPVSKNDPGKIEQAATSDVTIEMQVYYAQHWIDGKSVREWDVLNCKHVVNGKDLLAATRKNIGL